MTNSNVARNLRRFRLVTFDVTDTLLKFKRSPAIEYAKIAAKYGYCDVDQIKLEKHFKQCFKYMINQYPNYGCFDKSMQWNGWWKMLIQNLFKKSDANIPKEEVDKIANSLIELYKTNKCWKKVESAYELIDKIKDAGKIVGIISNFDPRLHEIIKAMNLPKFDFVLTSYEEKVAKPNPLIFQKALNLTGLRPIEALHIGNTLELDYLGAINAGWSAIHIANSEEKMNSYHKIKDNHLYSNLTELLDKIHKCNIIW